MNMPSSIIEALKAIALTNFRPFTQDDWMSLQGCESPEPLISHGDGDVVCIIDNDHAHFVDCSEAGDFREVKYFLGSKE